jgi:hypothetical protein
MARPMPAAPPVITARRPANLPVILSPFTLILDSGIAIIEQFAITWGGNNKNQTAGRQLPRSAGDWTRLHGIAGVYEPRSEEGASAILHGVADIGINFLKNSDLYSAGENKKLIGRAIAGPGDDYIIATEFGNVHSADGTLGSDGRPAYVQQS